MRNIVICLIFLVSGCVATSDADPLENIKPATAIKAVQRFRADPIAGDAMGYLSIVTNFAEQSDDVYVLIDEKYFPAQFAAIEGAPKQRLLGAYVAGNVESQLVGEVKSNQPFEGVRLMLYTYEVMREAGRLGRLSDFEEYLNLDKIGLLNFE